MKRVLAAVLGLLCIAPAVQAQIDRASLAGTVKDSAGGVLPGATVTVTNIATNVAAKATTSSSGTFLVVKGVLAMLCPRSLVVVTFSAILE